MMRGESKGKAYQSRHLFIKLSNINEFGFISATVRVATEEAFTPNYLHGHLYLI